MKINNYLDHNKVGICGALLYITTPHSSKNVCARPSNFNLITMIQAHICLHWLCIFIPFFLFVAEIAAFTDDGQFESALVE